MTIIRYLAALTMWSAWLYLFGAVLWYRGPTFPQDLVFVAVFAWLLLLDDPPANYPSYAAWRAARNARLARRKRRFTPLPS